MKKILKFIFAVVLAFLPGLFGIMFTPSGTSDAWYNILNKSVMTPDGWVFGAAWAVLYAILGIALFLIMNSPRRGSAKTRSYLLFGLQLVLNGLWSFLFFGLHQVLPAFVVILALIIISIKMMRAFRPVNRSASYLVIPYILWLIFAAYLNGVILYLN
ncbi:tryptophan-rich sensory protein [bacterium]|nr:tryptophan-rich sensory protein [bacterium]